MRAHAALDLEHAVDAVPAEVREQPLQPRLGAGEIQVVAETRLRADAADARLARIDLPRMEVEDRRLPSTRLTRGSPSATAR